MNTFKRLLGVALAVVMLLSAIPFSALAAPNADIPAEMLDNPYMDALEYIGYNVQGSKNNGDIFVRFGSDLGSVYASDVYYADGGGATGLETSNGLPNVAYFEANGLVCASYVTYVYFNYLPNVAKMDVSRLDRPTNTRVTDDWRVACDAWVAKGYSKKVSMSDAKPGAIVFFRTSSETDAHIGIYAGYYNGYHWVTHMGSKRGPEPMPTEYLTKGGEDLIVSDVYNVPSVFDEFGKIEIYKKDTSGKALAGAVFTATHNETGTVYALTETNSSGYTSRERLPYGTYTIKETKFPSGYESNDGTTQWTRTIDAGHKTITLNVVNKKITGHARIIKTSDDGAVGGVTFKITGNGVDITATTDGNGVTDVRLAPGTYTVTETVANKYEPQASQKVTVVANQIASVTFNNKLKRGDLEVTKTADDGLVEGAKFKLSGKSTAGTNVEMFATVNASGKATLFNFAIDGKEVGTFTL